MYFKAKDNINDKYSVVFPIKKGAYAETYRVKETSGQRYFLKLINPSLLSPCQLGSQGEIRELSIIESLNHPNLPHLIDKGEVEIWGERFVFFVNEFVSSETLADRLIRATTLPVYDTRQIALGVLNALKYLHNQANPIIHNEVTALNVLINLGSENLSDLYLIDFGYARRLDEAFEQTLDGLNWFYLAPERFDGCSTQQSDLYAVGALMYQLIFGMLPWFCDLSNVSPDKRKQYILKQKNTALLFPQIQKFELDDRLLDIMRKALAYNPDDRFQTAEEFIDAIQGKGSINVPSSRPTTSEDRADAFSMGKSAKGGGFDDVAGMEEFKNILRQSVLRLLKNPEKVKEYKLQMPNGILFYGPPGCGKSFLAEKFAEEAGYNYKLIKTSDLASIYVHGAQEKIGKLFEEARNNAPTILCFDEFDALVPKRGQTGAEHQSGEVNEFLTQLNNCGETGVFVIASTNRPDMIDPAVIRKGRIDKIIYVPIPDEASRAAMFELHLKGRPYDSNIDCQKLSSMTENFVASDIAFVVNEAASRAAFDDIKISQEILEEVVRENRPSLSASVINEFKKMREKMEGIVEPRRRIGF